MACDTLPPHRSKAANAPCRTGLGVAGPNKGSVEPLARYEALDIRYGGLVGAAPEGHHLHTGGIPGLKATPTGHRAGTEVGHLVLVCDNRAVGERVWLWGKSV